MVILPRFENDPDGVTDAVTRLAQKKGRVGMVELAFSQARSLGTGPTLVLNDFDLGPEYERLIEEVLEAGIRPDAIGLQSHRHQGFRGEVRQAEEMVRHYETLVAHPAVDAITYWGFDDVGAWLGAPADSCAETQARSRPTRRCARGPAGSGGSRGRCSGRTRRVGSACGRSPGLRALVRRATGSVSLRAGSSAADVRLS
ncbi:hypothetical protein [Rathayibacter rathayi]|uniref:hypothetical protein n=1 Tax=Rathayibacter rathayi TaxID=33887 RepID=UPI000BCAAEFE|nr:hypothetical protein [Rathayibacter rathayi]SOE04085.1 hypothetical protein SAMN06295924_103194 [Rathayibacter rathayi NCPPB 2980 = VKM Ac-1601]